MYGHDVERNGRSLKPLRRLFLSSTATTIPLSAATVKKSITSTTPLLKLLNHNIAFDIHCIAVVDHVCLESMQCTFPKVPPDGQHQASLVYALDRRTLRYLS
jgi:hypothetical protein